MVWSFVALDECEEDNRFGVYMSITFALKTICKSGHKNFCEIGSENESVKDNRDIFNMNWIPEPGNYMFLFVSQVVNTSSRRGGGLLIPSIF